ncbi:DNA polymerase [Acetobacter indonesiensis]|uniref:DNA polymerase n=1 Tax=Acetobacter indonesiensis TaxID=104101 RepID=A0A252AR87_9PROT|nr:DNA polymerase [Acetobacter indonesiensis]
MMDGALSLLHLYTEWGIDCAVGDTALDHRLAQLAPMSSPTPPPSFRQTAATPARKSVEPPSVQTGPDIRRPTPALSLPTAPPSLAESIALAQSVSNAATTSDSLRTAIDQFDACSLRTTAMHTLFPQGPHRAPLMIIGEAPDADEDRSGAVFSGLCGDLLNQMLAPIGLARADLLLATALPWRPPGGRPPTDAELRICQPFLTRAIALFEPQYLLLCGRLPARLLMKQHKVLPRRKWVPIPIAGHPADVPALIMRHPLQLRTSPTARKDIWQDLLLVAQTLQENAGNQIVTAGT